MAVSAGCFDKHEPTPNTVVSFNGKGTVIECYPESAKMLLQTDSGRHMAFWTSQTLFIKDNRPMTDYVVSKGANIEYRGVANRNEFWLRQVLIIKE